MCTSVLFWLVQDTGCQLCSRVPPGTSLHVTLGLRCLALCEGLCAWSQLRSRAPGNFTACHTWLALPCTVLGLRAWSQLRLLHSYSLRDCLLFTRTLLRRSLLFALSLDHNFIFTLTLRHHSLLFSLTLHHSLFFITIYSSLLLFITLYSSSLFTLHSYSSSLFTLHSYSSSLFTLHSYS